MKKETADQLRWLNQEFYQNFSSSFSSTRQHIQPGARRLLGEMPARGNFLDIGCGNGNLAVEWQKSARQGLYQGIDFSGELMEVAQEKVRTLTLSEGQAICFTPADVNDQNWGCQLPRLDWQIVVLFAVLHHIPSMKRREQLLRTIHGLLSEGGALVLSVWQLQNSPRLLRRVLPWSMVGIHDKDVDTGDVLIDWQAQDQNNSGKPGLRYVHLFSEEELAKYAGIAGFAIEKSFYSDGKEGNLALYQKWVKVLI